MAQAQSPPQSAPGTQAGSIPSQKEADDGDRGDTGRNHRVSRRLQPNSLGSILCPSSSQGGGSCPRGRKNPFGSKNHQSRPVSQHQRATTGRAGRDRCSPRPVTPTPLHPPHDSRVKGSLTQRLGMRPSGPGPGSGLFPWSPACHPTTVRTSRPRPQALPTTHTPLSTRII